MDGRFGHLVVKLWLWKYSDFWGVYGDDLESYVPEVCMEVCLRAYILCLGEGVATSIILYCCITYRLQ